MKLADLFGGEKVGEILGRIKLQEIMGKVNLHEMLDRAKLHEIIGKLNVHGLIDRVKLHEMNERVYSKLVEKFPRLASLEAPSRTTSMCIVGGGAVALLVYYSRTQSNKVEKLTIALRSMEEELCKEKEERQTEREGLVQAETTLEEELSKEREVRASERAGRIKAEKSLRSLGSAPTADAPIQTARWQSGGGGAQGMHVRKDSAYTSPEAKDPLAGLAFTPIGRLTSCFSQRNGTPRQPLLVNAARARLDLAAWVPPKALEGLEAYSHCWVLYLFHENTDGLGALEPSAGPPAPGATFRAKVRVPRLDGKKMGVLATRTPHRPVPIGLSLAKVESVSGRTLVISGADIVDGSPVVDIKPYLPFCEALPSATAPAWVQAETANEPLHISAVTFAEGAEQAISSSWVSRTSQLFDSPAAFLELVKQVLARDIRSAHKRIVRRGDVMHDPGNSAPVPPAEVMHVVLDGVDVSYTMQDRHVVVTGGEVARARPPPPAANNGAASPSRQAALFNAVVAGLTNGAAATARA